MADNSCPISRRSGKSLTVERLRQAVHYNPETGAFTRLTSYNNSCPSGTVLNRRNKGGYVVFSVDTCECYGHRAAWAYMTGEWPEKGKEIDHINGKPGDDRWANLRLTDHSGNMQNGRHRKNNTSGYKGVTKTREGNWAASITANGVAHHLGRFPTKEEAAAAYAAAATRLHGEFALGIIRFTYHAGSGIQIPRDRPALQNR